MKNIVVYSFTPTKTSSAEVVESFVKRGVSVSPGEAVRICFPSVLLHPPSLAWEFSASYGEMSRRSGEAA